MNTDKATLARTILTDNKKVLYGIFGQIWDSGYFPPRPLLNQFLLAGNDSCDQDGRMGTWSPFELSAEEYTLVKVRWIKDHPGTVESQPGVETWNDGVQEILNP